jgi:hypothetical protein
MSLPSNHVVHPTAFAPTLVGIPLKWNVAEMVSVGSVVHRMTILQKHLRQHMQAQSKCADFGQMYMLGHLSVKDSIYNIIAIAGRHR